METVNLIFGYSGRFSFGQDTVGLVAGDWVYEGIAGGGFVKTPLHLFQSRYHQQWEVCEIPCISKDLCYTRAKSLLGTPPKQYLTRIFKWGYNQSSESMAYCLGWLREDNIQNISPEYLWLASKTISKGTGKK